MRKTLTGSAFFLVWGIIISGVAAWGETPNNGSGVLTFSVKIAADNAPVSSSPGEENCYQTGFLKAGDVVEVCFRTDSGWCAIRPPEGSFSWISGDYVNRRDQNSGTVVCPEDGKEVPVRVGTDSVLKSSGVQVGLKNGREVKILGETTLTGGKTWLKIAPPRGEFRWINENLLVRDPFFAQIPNRLTRYEELLAKSEGDSVSATQSAMTPSRDSAIPAAESGRNSDSKLELARLDSSEEANRLHEEVFDPESPQNSIPETETITKVSFENGFNKELAQLYRDLFTAVERSGSDEIYDLLAQRASVLFTLAADDVQRTEAQKAFDKINAHRGVLFSGMTGGPITEAGGGLTEASPIYQSPARQTLTGGDPGSFVREDEKIVFSVEPKTKTESPSNESAPSNGGIRFAFAPKRETPTKTGGQSGNDKSDNKKGFFAGKPSTIVPPANYSYPSPTLLKVAPQEASAPKGETPGGTSTPKVDQPANSGNPFLAESSSTPRREIRQVAAFVKPELPNEASGRPNADSASNSRPQAGPPAQLPIPSNVRYDASGTLGYFPNQTDGVPAYALVNQTDGKLVILCYVAPQKGKSLDPFVGKKIGIGGTKGWFKKGEENRKMITAESIHLLEN